MTATSSSFNKGSAEFVPKGKIVKTTESFPTLGEGLNKEPVKKKAVVTALPMKKEEPEQ